MPSEVIQWFPGHMAKTRRLIAENLKNVDIVIELLDARIPFSSQNPEIARIVGDKPRLTILTKAALADPTANRAWIRHFDGGTRCGCILLDCQSGEGLDRIAPAVRRVLSEKIERYAAKGMENRRLKAMIVGIPNVGKSTLINRICGGKKAKAENRPGVTTQKQWVPTAIGLDLLDMPGVLWPKFEDSRVGENLALTGAIKDDILDRETLATILCRRLRTLCPETLASHYKLGDAEALKPLSDRDLFEAIGRKRGNLMAGGVINTERTANMLLDEFRSAKIGRITLEMPPEKAEKKQDAQLQKSGNPEKNATEKNGINMLEYTYEKEYGEQGYAVICGLDEAGRGPLSGPVAAGACILPLGLEIPGLNDSKKLSEKQRERLYDMIREQAVAYGIGLASPQEIDEMNILAADMLAMRRAIEDLKAHFAVSPDLLLIDGNYARGFDIPAITIVKGDAKSPSIAAASILAKVTRDRICMEHDALYPDYGFARHKGYPTKEHKEKIEELGILPIHRRTFLKFLNKAKPEENSKKK